MYDAKKIVPGLIIFLALASFPIWCTATGAAGDASKTPEIVYPKDSKKCVESTDYMRAYHMDLLDDWRDESIRNGLRTYVATDGSEYEASLTNTCLEQCHTNKTTFCDSCHEYSDVDPYCWDCHVLPKGSK